MDKIDPNSLDFDCDWSGALNFQPGTKATMGYLLTWNGCGGLNLAKAIEIPHPAPAASQQVTLGNPIQCIGVLESFRFDGGETDPIRMRAYVSKSAAAEILGKLARPLTSTKLKLAWCILAYDSDKKCWYESSFVKSPAQASASLDAVEGRLQMFVDRKPTKIAEHLDIHVYGFDFQVVPSDGSTSQLEFASGLTRRLVRTWGE